MNECPQCGRSYDPHVAGQPLCDACLAKLRHAHAEQQEHLERPRHGWTRPNWNEIVKSPTWIIIAINVVAFIVVAIKARTLRDFDTRTLMPFGANFGAYSLRNQPWRMVTAIFLHGGVAHLLLNMWALLNLGLLAELLFGAGPFLVLYFMAGIGGSIASSWWHPGAVGVGASGAIFGIAGALLPALSLHPNPRLRAALRGSLLSIGFFVLYTLTYGARAKQTDNAAHIGGLLVGIVLGLALPAFPGRSPELNSRRRLAFVGGAAVLAAAFFWAQHQRRAETEFAQAFEYVQKHDYARAAELARRSVQHDPKSLSSNFLLGNLYIQLGDNAHAAEQFRNTIALNPKFAPGYAQLCVAQFRLDQVQDALKSCQKAVEIDPRDPDSNFNLGLAYEATGQVRQAADAFGTAAQLRPNGAEELYSYGLALLQLGDTDRAITELSRAKQLKPQDGKITAALERARAIANWRSK